MTKNLLLCIGMLLCIVSTKAQNVTVNPGGGSYATFKGAVDAINAGTHTGAITVSIVGNTTETDSSKLAASGTGSASYTSITISPSGGAARTISGNIAGSMIILDGADNVTFNGLNTGGNSLTIANIATGSTNTILLRNDATGNTITNCIIQGSASAAAFAVINFGLGTTTGNDNNTISNSDITAAGSNQPLYCIYSAGTSTAIDNSSISITGNKIYDFFNASLATAAINVASGSSGWTINNNKFYQTATRTYTTANTHQVINIAGGSGYTITGNTIGYASSTSTGVYTMTGTIATRLVAIAMSLSAGTASSVQNNTITAINLTTSSGAATANGVLCGISVTAGDANIGTVTGNTFGSTTGVDALVATPSTTQGSVVGVNVATTGTVTIANNTFGGFTSSSTTASVAGGVFGVTVSAVATLLTINDNIFGNTVTDNMKAGISGTTTGSSLAAAISLASTPTQTNIYNNTIRNFSSYGTGTSGYVRGIFTSTTTTVTASANIYNNTIYNLSSSSTLTGLSSGLSCAQGIHYLSGVGANIYGNTIYNIASLNTGTGSYVATGIALAGSTVTTTSNTSVYKNRIYGITNAGTGTTATGPPIIAGISIRSGNASTVIYNNMISLGNGVTANVSVIGIWGNHGSTPNPVTNIYFNTVNIEGTVASGALSTFGYYRGDFSTTARTPTVDIRNNIFNNVRTGGTGGHYAISNGFGATTVSATGWGANASNYNIYNTVDPNKLAYWGADQSFAAWKTASASDVNSFAGAAQTFTNTVTADLHLSLSIATVAESAGTPIAAITDDFDGQNRSSLTPTDIGADAANFIALDLVGPSINYTPLINTLSTTNRVLTGFATITDLNNVNTTTGTRPRLYFKRSTDANTFNNNTNASDGWKFVEASNTASPFDFTINYSLLNGGSVTQGTQIQYFVIAQDLNGTPNVGISSNLTFTVSPTSVALTAAAFPIVGTPTAYYVSLPYSGSYNVGSSAPTYTTLKSFFDAVNNGIVTGNITVNIVDNTTETATAQLNQWQESGVGNYTMLIKPTGTRTITGSSTGALVNINGADRVTIDGSVGSTANTVCPSSTATRDLTFSNTNTGTTSAVVWIGNDNGTNPATNITVQNCIITGSGPAATLIGVGAGSNAIGNAGKNNDNIVFTNNNISACQYAIYAAGESSLNKSSSIVVNKNIINAAAPNNVGVGGIAVFYYNNITVSGNNVGEIIRTGSPDCFGINVGAGVNAFSATATGLADGISNASITNNIVGNVQNSGTFSAIGICIGGTTTGTTVIANNAISGVSANGTSGDIGAGIWIGSVANTTQVYHNTVTMQGTIQGATAGSQTNACFMYTGTTAPTGLDVRNNIFSNTQLGNASSTSRMSVYAIGFAAPYTGNTFNYNSLFCAGAGPGTYVMGITGGAVSGTSKVSFADWQTETSQEANSTNTNVPFTSTSNLLPTNFTGLAGTPVGINTDINCSGRGTPVTIGAFQNPAAVPVVYTSFQAVKQNAAVLVQWQTANEVNNDYFLVQYSTDGNYWIDLTTIKAKNASSNSYSFVHSLPVQGKNYYRLKQVDKDARYNMSAVRVVDFSGKQATVAIYPNPVVGNSITIDLGRSLTTPITYQIYNSVGERVQIGTINATQQTISLSKLSTGSYLIRLSSGETLKMLKQ